MRVPIALLYEATAIISTSDRLWAVDEYYRMANKRIISPDKRIVGVIRESPLRLVSFLFEMTIFGFGNKMHEVLQHDQNINRTYAKTLFVGCRTAHRKVHIPSEPT